jgi:hypothetical protein
MIKQIDVQKLFDEWSELDFKTRSNYHLTVGELEELCQRYPKYIVSVDGYGIWGAGSYRGYYTDVGLEPSHSPQSMNATEILSLLQRLRINGMEGYKGGEYQVKSNTPLWYSDYGSASGWAIVSHSIENDKIVLHSKNID